MTLLLSIATAIGAGAVGGVYLAFSVMVMPAFGRLPASEATAAMREINRRAERGPFIAVFVLAALLALALGIVAALQLPAGSAVLLLVGAALSFASTAVTAVGNVPLNNRLEREGASFWEAYHSRWTRLNTVRALMALAGVGCIVAAGAS